MTDLKVITHTPKHVETAYFKAVSALDEASAKAMLKMTDYQPHKTNHWIGASLMKQAKLVSHNTGVDVYDVFNLIREQFTVLFLSHPDEKNEALLGTTIKYASVYIQSILFSEKAKKSEAKSGSGFILKGGHVDNSRTVAIDNAKAMMIDDLLATLFKRQDQRNFVKTILMHGQERAQRMLGLATKDFNKKLKRALESIERGRDKQEYQYVSSLMAEVLESANDTELTEQEQLEALYQESVSIF